MCCYIDVVQTIGFVKEKRLSIQIHCYFWNECADFIDWLKKIGYVESGSRSDEKIYTSFVEAECVLLEWQQEPTNKPDREQTEYT